MSKVFVDYFNSPFGLKKGDFIPDMKQVMDIEVGYSLISLFMQLKYNLPGIKS